MALQLDWTKCKGDVWCNFTNLNLDHPHFNDLSGVYIVWSGKNVIKIGSGIIKEEIAKDRLNIQILAYPDLKVVWAAVDPENFKGVECFLKNRLHPKITEPEDATQNVDIITVNFPWW